MLQSWLPVLELRESITEGLICATCVYYPGFGHDTQLNRSTARMRTYGVCVNYDLLAFSCASYLLRWWERSQYQSRSCKLMVDVLLISYHSGMGFPEAMRSWLKD